MENFGRSSSDENLGRNHTTFRQAHGIHRERLAGKTGSMTKARSGHMATLLADGRVCFFPGRPIALLTVGIEKAADGSPA